MLTYIILIGLVRILKCWFWSLCVNYGYLSWIQSMKRHSIFKKWSREVCKRISFTDDMFTIKNFEFDNAEFKKVIYSGSHLRELKFIDWEIKLKEWIIPKNIKFNVEMLWLDYWGKPNRSNWRDYPKRLINILTFISKSSLRKSLCSISLKGWYLEKSHLRLAVQYLKLTKIKFLHTFSDQDRDGYYEYLL
jgi:hypothetical protein